MNWIVPVVAMLLMLILALVVIDRQPPSLSAAPPRKRREWLTMECANPTDLETVLDEQDEGGWELHDIIPIYNPSADLTVTELNINTGEDQVTSEVDLTREGCAHCEDVSLEPQHPVTYTVVWFREFLF